jgi:hypothetical protein
VAGKAYLDCREHFPVGWVKGYCFAHHDELRFARRTPSAACLDGGQENDFAHPTRWRDGNTQEFSRNTNNAVAEARAGLMGKIADFMK